MKPFLFLISGFGTSVTCWERWGTFFKKCSNIRLIETPLPQDRLKIGKIRLADYTDKIIEEFSTVVSNKNQKIVAVAHSAGGIALLKAIQKNPPLFKDTHLVLLSSVAPKGLKPVINIRVLIGFLSSILKSLPGWNKPCELDFYPMRWLLTDKQTFSKTDRNHIKKYLQTHISGSLGIELLLNFDSLKVDIDKIKNTLASILVVNTKNDKFGDTKQIADAFNCRYMQMEGSHYSYFAGSQVETIMQAIHKLYFKEKTSVTR